MEVPTLANSRVLVNVIELRPRWKPSDVAGSDV